MTERILDEKQQVIADNIRNYRIQKGLTQEDVASGLCSVSQFSKMENGKVPFKPELLKEISKRLGVSIDQLSVVDNIEQELCEELEMFRNALTVSQMEAGLRYARSVIDKARKHGYTELLVEGIMAECRALNWTLQFAEIIDRVEKELFAEGSPFSSFQKMRLYMELVHAYIRVGNVEVAQRYFRTAEDMYLELREQGPLDIQLAVDIVTRLTSVHYDLHNYRTALPYARESTRLAAKQDQLNWKFFAVCAEAELLKRIGKYEQAEQLYLTGLEEAKKLSSINYVAVIQTNLGRLYLTTRQLGMAQTLFERSVKNFELVGGVEGICEATLNLAEVALLSENDSAANEYLQKASDLLTVHTVGVKYTARKHELLSRLYRSLGDRERGIEELQQALRTYEEHCAFYEAYQVSCQLADWFYEQGDPSRATEYYRKAVEYDRRVGPTW